MDILFFAFANNPENPLPALQDEDEFIYSLLAPRQAQGHFVIHRDQAVSIETLAEYLSLYRNDIVLFHYSGHAGKEHLSLDDELAHSLGIAELLGNCPRLKFVLLNGCSTVGQVSRLLEKQIPIVIATSSSVEDEKAKEFAIQFYRSLYQQENVNQAFEAARAKILTINSSVSFHRGLDLPNSAIEEPIWGIFQPTSLSEIQEWYLPSSTINSFGHPLVVNELLLSTLVDTFSVHNPVVKKIWENEALGGTSSILAKRESVLKCLPHPISEQVRKLLVPDSGNGAVFYDKAGLPRLNQITTVYDTILELVTFIMLAQLWETLNNSGALKVDDEVKAQVKRFLSIKASEREEWNFIPLIATIHKYLMDNQLSYFMDELKNLSTVLKEGGLFFEACQILNSIKKRIKNNKIGATEALGLCSLAEERLSNIFSELGFFANYTLASVRNIKVAKYRHSKEVTFKHAIVMLVQSLVGLEEEVKVMQGFMDTASILLLKSNEEQDVFLNLTPFIIDENTFDERGSNLSNLYYFDYYTRDNDTYTFRHVIDPSNQLLKVSNQVNFIILKVQFEAFSQALFNNPMRKTVQ